MSYGCVSCPVSYCCDMIMNGSTEGCPCKMCLVKMTCMERTCEEYNKFYKSQFGFDPPGGTKGCYI